MWVNQQKTTISASILWEELRLNRFWSEKRCRNSTFTLAAKTVSSLLLLTHTWWCENITVSPCGMQGSKNPLARHPGLVISTFGLAEIISCMPDGLVKIYIGYWQTCHKTASTNDSLPEIPVSYGILNPMVNWTYDILTPGSIFLMVFWPQGQCFVIVFWTPSW